MKEILQDFYKFTEENRLFVFFATYFLCEMIIVVTKAVMIGINNIVRSYKGMVDVVPPTKDTK